MRVKPPERTVSMTLLPGGVGAGLPHPALLMGVVITVSAAGFLALAHSAALRWFYAPLAPLRALSCYGSGPRFVM